LRLDRVNPTNVVRFWNARCSLLKQMVLRGPCAVPGLDASAHLANNDAFGYFSRLNQLVLTGPTLTNVNDFRAILIR
jgi:glycerate-2-kinase